MPGRVCKARRNGNLLASFLSRSFRRPERTRVRALSPQPGFQKASSLSPAPRYKRCCSGGHRARAAQRQCRRAAEQRDEPAPFHCLVPPVLLTERIAHLGTADCCIHPPGRNEMIAITPPKIFSKEVAQNRPPRLPRQQPQHQNRFTPNFRG